MSLNRPSGCDRIVFPTAAAPRGGSGTFTPDLSGADASPWGPGFLHGLADGFNWQNVRLVSNRLHGTGITGAPPYDDSICLFPGTWGRDVTITATIYRGPNATAAGSQEIELLLCGQVGPYHASFYEVMISVHGSNAYADIVRWNGGGGNVIGNYEIAFHNASAPVVNNGDIFKAEKIGNTIKSYLNSGSGFVEMATIDITAIAANPYGPAVYTQGLPGVGFYQRLGASSNLLEFGLTNVSVSAP